MIAKYSSLHSIGNIQVRFVDRHWCPARTYMLVEHTPRPYGYTTSSVCCISCYWQPVVSLHTYSTYRRCMFRIGVQGTYYILPGGREHQLLLVSHSPLKLLGLPASLPLCQRNLWAWSKQTSHQLPPLKLFGLSASIALCQRNLWAWPKDKQTDEISAIAEQA